jgi:hypothetical protein
MGKESQGPIGKMSYRNSLPDTVYKWKSETRFLGSAGGKTWFLYKVG